MASAMPDRVHNMTARILQFALGKANPVYPPSDMNAACQAMVQAGGFFVPWAPPPPPPSPPGPPITPTNLAGTYLLDGTMPVHITIPSMLSSQATAPGLSLRDAVRDGTIHMALPLTHHGVQDNTPAPASTTTTTTTFPITVTGCSSCCWTTGNGTVTPAIGGGMVNVVARGPSCSSPRVCSGTIVTAAAPSSGFQPVTIAWKCTCTDPTPRSCGAFGESPWVKQNGTSSISSV